MQKAQQQAHLVVRGNPSTTNGAILNPTETGGSGYKVGDRLRLVGGTPVADPYGGILLKFVLQIQEQVMLTASLM